MATSSPDQKRPESVSLLSSAQAQTPPVRTNLACIDQAEDRTTLSDRRVRQLCSGTRSLGPITCFERAEDDTALSDAEMVYLCRCAENDRPVRCYQRFQEVTFVDDARIIESCRPIRVERLRTDCTRLVQPNP